ncbi:hypothetical protein D9M69_684250 [compost metagenome]
MPLAEVVRRRRVGKLAEIGRDDDLAGFDRLAGKGQGACSREGCNLDGMERVAVDLVRKAEIARFEDVSLVFEHADDFVAA